jgi:hypothetical protein
MSMAYGDCGQVTTVMYYYHVGSTAINPWFPQRPAVYLPTKPTTIDTEKQRISREAGTVKWPRKPRNIRLMNPINSGHRIKTLIPFRT